MKEGYIQMKLSEFNDKCIQLEQMLTMEESKIRLLQEKVTIAEIKKENETLLNNQLQETIKHLNDILKDITTSKTDAINDTLAFLKQREEDLTAQSELLEKHTKQLIYLIEHNEILMMKLVNRKVLNEHDVVEMQRRATKKAEATE
jgi:DNA-binding transcriptional regulator YbjK